jgi:uncharacterized membrane protein YoaK (UPF0700 family)
MFFNSDILGVYVTWQATGVPVVEVLLGVTLFIVGVVGAYLLVRYQRKKDEETASLKEKE